MALGPQGLLALLVGGMFAVRYTVAQKGGRGPPPGGMTMGGGGGGSSITKDGVTTASLRGSIGTGNDGQLIYGPFDAGFSANQICNGHDAIVGGTDTFLATALARYGCNDDSVSLFDSCGGHARPYHYHEGLTCLYEPDAASGHSTSAGALNNDQKLYGKWEAEGVLPELDACNGHFGVTPDSNGESVYHYHVTDEAPFTAGCIGPAIDEAGNEQLVTVEQCRAVYSTCDGATSDFVIGDGITMTYDLDCPCFDKNERNYGEIAALTYSHSSAANGATEEEEEDTGIDAAIDGAAFGEQVTTTSEAPDFRLGDQGDVPATPATTAAPATATAAPATTKAAEKPEGKPDGKPEKPEKDGEKPDGKPEKPEKAGEKPDGKPDGKPEKPEKAGEKPDAKPDGKPEKPEKAGEKPDGKPDGKPEKPEQPEGNQKPEKPSGPGSSSKPSPSSSSSGAAAQSSWGMPPWMRNMFSGSTQQQMGGGRGGPPSRGGSSTQQQQMGGGRGGPPSRGGSSTQQQQKSGGRGGPSRGPPGRGPRSIKVRGREVVF